ncbi:molybdenum ABC transporter substrate-binding protein [Actinomyces sp. oral taxon 414]|uniref:molybdate ABC transporter substrate-binding protein n=1 Tax=Actinomyces sp. oral taxon 414 TaxID=712122 RepID=UPI0006AFF74A|nr:molybdate ABC transporter substrate-binding protein [Actinomyces sp. oral taxon 414]ALC99689.1 molybdenum ABC transporter substrate-binding protein [Actinomyces sp. oral taxon 414]
MRLSRRLAITALTFVSAASLVACGGASDSTNSAAPATAASADTAITGEVTVFAAASLQDAFQELATSFEAAHAGVHITFDFQGSQDLVTALDGGSPADVLATANNSTMTDAANKGLVGEQTEFATNVLTLIVPAGNPAGVTGINDGSLDNADLVICAPEVPCGEATAKLADELGVTLNPVSEEQKVTDVRGKVESGEAQAGIVYTTDAAKSGSKVEPIALPANSVINHYPIALTKSAGNPQAAQAFIDYILSPEGQKVLQDTYGFGAPGGSASGTTATPAATPAGTATPATPAVTPAEAGTPTEAGTAAETSTGTTTQNN